MIISTIFSMVFLFVVLHSCAQSSSHGLADSSSGSSGSLLLQERILEPSDHFTDENANVSDEEFINSQIQSFKIINYDEFASEILEQHNIYRLQHGVPPLVLSLELSVISQDWADTLVQRGTTDLRPNNLYGENIYRSESSDPDLIIHGSVPVDTWYNTIFDYDFTNPTFLGPAGAFTQIVWKDSKVLGVGASTDGKGAYYVVCNYDPPGNVLEIVQ